MPTPQASLTPEKCNMLHFFGIRSGKAPAQQNSLRRGCRVSAQSQSCVTQREKGAHRSKYAAVAPTKISITEPASNHPLKGGRPWPNDGRFQHFSNHAAERYGSTRGARSPEVNPWLVARSVSCHGCAVATSPHLCCPEGISSLVFRKVCRRDPLRGTVDVGDS